LVGCGTVSDMHLMGIRDRAPQINITAAVDPVAERAAAVASQTGAETFTSLSEAIEKGDFDAVDLMLPHHLHERFAIEAFEAGKHVLLEKPMAVTIAACERIMAAAARAGTVFMVAENAQYWPEVLRARQLIEEGAVGRLVSVRASINMPMMRGNPFYAGDKPWRFNKQAAGGGIALDVGSHWIRPLRMWLGEVDEVVAALGRPAEDMEGESLVRALLRFRSGLCATFEAGMFPDAVLGSDAMFRIMGSKGEIVIESTAGGRLVLYDEENMNGRKEEPQGYLKSYGPEFEDFALAVLEGKPLEAGPEESIGELRTALAMYRSAESKRWEKVWD
ncbi:MAG: Gfo/Idh/MocA family oxidoreductase, partial [Deltaproteobacteria bacterium]